MNKNRSLPKIAAIFVIIAVVNFVAMLVRGYLAELNLRNSGFFISHWTPYRTESLLLLIAAICLISTRFWILFLSILLSGWVLYALSFLRWKRLVLNTYEIPIFSWLSVQKISNSYIEYPQILFELILGCSILVAGFVMLWRLRSRSEGPRL